MRPLEMTRDLQLPISPIVLPEGYSVIAVNEQTGHLWESVIGESWGGRQAGDFRYCMVSNNGYEEDRVFVLLNESKNPIATASAWFYGSGHWYTDEYPQIIYVGVIPFYQGRGFGKRMVNHAMLKLKERGYSVAHLDIRGTDAGENYSAVKTYLDCGFIPYITEETHITIWEKVYSHLSMPSPVLRYEKPLRAAIMIPDPPRPWPYQVRCAAETQRNGDTYIFGLWQKHNMYLVDVDRYIQLKPLLMLSGKYESLVSDILAGHAKRIYIDRPRNPQSLFFIRDDNSCLHIGRSSDERFGQGIEQYLKEQKFD